jgi:hypothetical protein
MNEALSVQTALISRHSNSALGGRGLKSAAELSANRAHGDRLRYMGGCRCDECRKANTSYESERNKARANGDWNGIVSADKARSHIQRLSEMNVGRRAVSLASGVAESTIAEVANGRKTRIRGRTERNILNVTRDAVADHALIPAAETWKQLNTLIRSGYTRSDLAYRLGYKGRGLQIKKDFVTAINAYLVAALFAQLKLVSSKDTECLLRELQEKGFTRSKIERCWNELAASPNVSAPTFEFKNGVVSAVTAEHVQKLHALLTT